MKILKNNIYKNIASILVSDNDEFKSAQNIILFTRIISSYPSKSVFCLVINRVITFIEKNVRSVSLMLDIMKNEGEDEEIIENIEFLRNNPTIKTQQEVSSLCAVLSDYVRYEKILKIKDSFIASLDVIDDESDMHKNIESLNSLSREITTAYNAVPTTSARHTFDTVDPESAKYVVANALDERAPDKTILTGVRGINTLLSPGYLSGCVYVYAALPGNYKSGILLESHVDTCKFNEHIHNITNGKTPISMYISMENTMSQTVIRLWSILFPTADITMFTVDESTDMINKALTEKGFRSVILYYGYREKSTADLGQIIQSYNDDKYEVVAVYLDYIKRIRSSRTDNIVMASEKNELGAIMNELKTIATQYNIPIVTGHQLNRAAAAAVDALVATGGYNKTEDAMGRSNIGSSWDVIEAADFVAVMNIENNGETKMLMMKAVKQRDVVNKNDEAAIIGIHHPFISLQSFALKTDINENISMSTPIYIGKRTTNFLANI